MPAPAGNVAPRWRSCGRALLGASPLARRLPARIADRRGYADVGTSTVCATPTRPSLSEGLPIKVVSERLGHTTIAMTLDLYGHVLPAMDAAGRLDSDAMLELAPETAPGPETCLTPQHHG